MEPRKGWMELIEAFVKEFSHADDVSLFIHASVFPGERERGAVSGCRGSCLQSVCHYQCAIGMRWNFCDLLTDYLPPHRRLVQPVGGDGEAV